MTKSELVAVRQYLPSDMNFIYASWLKGLYYGDSWYSEVVKKSFMQNYHKVLDFLLAKPSTVITVACLKDEPEVILGYSVQTPSKNVVHWVFIKKQWRKIGLAKDLVSKSADTATHATKVGMSIIKNKKWAYDPFLINL